MNKETLKALEASIVKWEQNTKANNLNEIDISATSCPLCQLFLFSYRNEPSYDSFKSCMGCPIYERTNKPSCRDTPYAAVEEALQHNNREAVFDAVQAELTFLRSLRPTKC